jgi:asparagine synthase (glutamine-hydrolysing)
MSSIFGFILNQGSEEQQQEIAARMSQALKFRGDLVVSTPRTGGACLGATQFELDTVQSCYASSLFAIVLEGEIYNQKQLIKELGLDKSAREGEIIQALYRRDGLDFARELNGIFVIALYDRVSGQVVLARDHVGGRSLYYARNRQGLFFATTTRALLSSGMVEPELSQYGIGAYFSSTAISPPDTMYAGISCLRPGAVICFSPQGEITDHTYWNIREIQEDTGRSLESFAEELRHLLIDAIEARGDAGARFGSIVSGGVDTSTITSVLARHWRCKQALPVFSIVFDEIPYSDAELQQVMYRSYHLEPTSAVITAREYWNLLHKAVANLDAPINDDAMVGMYRVFQMASDAGCSALFDGEAADELFFTGHVHSERRFQKYLTIPYGVRKHLLGSLFRHYPHGGGLGTRVQRQLFKLGLSDTERRLLVIPSFYRNRRPILREQPSSDGRDPLATARGYLMETRLRDPLNIYYYGLLKNFLPDVLLYKNERMAAANQITNRTPFIDYRLVELALRIPEKFKVTTPTETDDGTKIVYKKAVEGVIPERILRRKKTRGFSIPSSEWYRNELQHEVRDLLFSKDALHQEYLDSSHVADIYQQHQQAVPGSGQLFNSILVFEMWLREHAASGATGRHMQ